MKIDAPTNYSYDKEGRVFPDGISNDGPYIYNSEIGPQMEGG